MRPTVGQVAELREKNILHPITVSLCDDWISLVQADEERDEIMGEWAAQARTLVSADFDFGHGCPSCTITRVLDFLAGAADV